MIQNYRSVYPDELERGRAYTIVFSQPKNGLTLYPATYASKQHNPDMADNIDAPLYSFACEDKDERGKPIVLQMTSRDVRECVKAGTDGLQA